MGDLTDGDCRHAKRVREDFQIINVDIYHDLYVRSNAVLLADVLEIFQSICFGIHKLDPAHFLTALGLAW